MEIKFGRKVVLSDPVHFYGSDFNDGLTKVTKFNHLIRDENRCPLYLYGASAGLILLILSGRGDEIDKLILWNPTTQRCKKLPSCPSITSPDDFYNCGLGYDSAADDYMVIMFSIVSKNDDYARICQVWIFNLKSNSWRWSRDLPFDNVHHIIGSPFGFVNGALYWESVRGRLLYGFDIANEKLFTFPDFRSFQVQGHLKFHHFLTALESKGYVLGSECREGFQYFYWFVTEDSRHRGQGNWRQAFRCNGSEIFSFEE